MIARFAMIVGLVGWAWFALGCGPHVLRGRVVQGDVSRVTIVEPDDPMLDSPPIEGATVELTLDPDTLGREVLATRSVGPDGSFAIPIDEFGAGVLEYDFGVLARHRGREPARHVFRLPSRDQRLLVILGRGTDRPLQPGDPLEGAEPFLPPR